MQRQVADVGPLDLVAPALELAADVVVALGQVAQADRVDVGGVHRDLDVDQ